MMGRFFEVSEAARDRVRSAASAAERAGLLAQYKTAAKEAEALALTVGAPSAEASASALADTAFASAENELDVIEHGAPPRRRYRGWDW